MQPKLKIDGQTLGARFPDAASCGRLIKTMTLSVAASLWLAPGVIVAKSETKIPLSPAVAQATRLSALDPSQEIRVVLSLPLSDAPGAAAFVHSVSDPKDPLYRQYLTPDEFAARFGGSEADYAALKEWAIVNGLTIAQESCARTALTLRGSVDQFEKVFRTRLDVYRSATDQQFYSASVEPTIPDTIASMVDGVIGLTDGPRSAASPIIYKTFGETPVSGGVKSDTTGTGPGGAYSASDLRTAYSIPAFGGVTPQTVAVLEQAPFYESHVKSDVEQYAKTMGLPAVPLEFVKVNSENLPENPVSELVAVLDIDMITGINPAASEVLVYVANNLSVGLIDVLHRVAKDNKAQILNISFYLDESQQGAAQLNAENTALIQLAAQGITVLAAAGDNGAYVPPPGCGQEPSVVETPTALAVYDPGSQPLVTCVGGTTLYTGPGEGYSAEDVWNDLGFGAPCSGGGGATGGGVSSYWKIPSYQLPSYVANNGGSKTMRNVPDVAAIADEFAGVAIYSKVNGGWLQLGGTEVSTPLWSGYLSILNAGLEYLIASRIGQFNPLLYRLHGLFSVVDGSNGNVGTYGTAGYNAGPGYNNCTGNGTPPGGDFAYEVLTSEPQKTQPGAFSAYVAVKGTTATLTWTASREATGYVTELDYFLPDGTSYSAAYVTKTDRKLTLTGLPREVEYNFIIAAVNPDGYYPAQGQFIVP
jgi:subtilase family serine protease